MNRYFRWQGFVSFIAVIAIIAGLFYLFAEPLIKKAIEKGTSLYTGAEVNVEEVDLTYSPLSLTVIGFQATDPEKPTLNMVSFKKAKAGVDVWQYLFGKVIIDDLIVEGVAFANERASVGDVYLAVESEEEEQQKDKLSLDEIKDNLPSAKEVINNSNLLTVKAGKELQSSYKTELENLKNIKEELPSKELLKQYQAEVKALADIKIKTPQDLAKLKEQYDALKIKFKAEKAKLKKAKEQFASSKNIITNNVVALKNAPQQDWQVIEQKYQLDSFEGGDLAHIIFGEQAREYYDIAETAYQKLAPMLAAKKTPEQIEKLAAEGRFVPFDEEQALPELLIKKALFSVVSEQGDFVIEFNEFTHQHWIRNNPTLYKLYSDNVKGKGRVSLNGDFTVQPNSDFNSQGKWSLADLLLDNIPLEASDKLALLMTQADLFAGGNFTISSTNSNNNIDASNSFEIINAKYENKSDNKLSKIVMETLADKDKLVVDLGVLGNIQQPSLSISSPLDDIFKDALNKQIDSKVAEFKSKVQSGLQEKLTQQLGLSAEEQGELGDVEGLLADSDNLLDNLLSSNVVKQQEDKLKDKAKDKLKDKLKGKLGDLF